MKKFIKYFFLIPIIFVAIFSLFACGDDDVKSINLSVANYELTEGSYIIDKSQIVPSGNGEKRLFLNVQINPDKYSVNNIKFDFKNFNGPDNKPREIVKEVRVRDKNIYVILGSSIGQASITASYTRKDNIKVQSTIKLLVSDTTNSLKFGEYTYTTTYRGENLEEDADYRVIGDEEGNLNYTYYQLNVDNKNEPKEVEHIIKAGRYWITCEDPNNENAYAETFLIVNKYRFTFEANNHEICYGDELPETLHYQGSIGNSILLEDNAVSIEGIGKDKNKKIGKMIEVTSAKKGSNVGLYPVTIAMSLSNDGDYKENYDTEFDVIEGSLRITAKEVVLRAKSQVGNNSVKYGDTIRNGFELYSYSQYMENGEDISKCDLLNVLSSVNDVDYTKDVSLGNAVYKVNGEVAQKNQAGQLDVLINSDNNADADSRYNSYEVTFENATTGRNLILKVLLSGQVTIEPRSVSILPVINQSKMYGTSDPVSIDYNVVIGSVINHDNIINPLRINYDYVIDGDLGEGNYLANAGTYYYKLENNLNPNYNFILHERAMENSGPQDDGESGKPKVTFVVNPCPIEIKLKNRTERYKTPTGIQLNDIKLHTVGYYGSAEDYKLEIDYVKVNGKLADISNIEDATSGQQGKIDLEMGGKFYFIITVDENVIKGGNSYLTYNIKMDEVNGWQTLEGAVKNNYTAELLPSTLSLTKNKVIVTPNEDIRFRKVFDAVENGEEIFDDIAGSLYTAIDENGIEIDLDEVVVNSNSLLTLLKDDSYYKLKSDGSYETQIPFRNVGFYKIFLVDEISYNEGMEYYDLVLDDSKEYYYEITKATLLISVKEGQSKVYGAVDPILEFENSSLAVGDDVEREGFLSRVAGEDVGEYAINIGTLSFGENYLLSLSSINMFSITPRTINIKPYSYSYIYGENDVTPLYNYSIEGGYDSSLLVPPEFSGAFTITDPDNENNVVLRDGAGYYPVKIRDNEIASYSISQGSFACLSNNYQIVFDNSESSFTITKRNATIDIIAQKRDNLGTVEKDKFILDNQFYTVSNLVGNVIKVFEIKIGLTNNYYCAVNKENLEDYNLQLKIGEENVLNNYNVVLGANIVYRIDLAIVYLSIVDKVLYENEGIESSVLNTTYNGEAFNDVFKLISKTENYEIDYENSKFKIIFRKGQWNGISPINAGNYVASFDLSGEDDKLVIINRNAQEESKSIIFTKDNINTMQGNIVVNTSSLGYFNVDKAKIEILNTPTFEDNFVYGNKVLPRLSTTNAQYNAIFGGVNNEHIQLREFIAKDSGGNIIEDGFGNPVKLNFLGTGYSISNFQANYVYNIMVSVQKVVETLNDQDRGSEDGRKVGDVDSNYETLVISSVPLKVVPKPMNVAGSKFHMKNGNLQMDNLTYDGSLKSVTLFLDVKIDNTDLNEKHYTTTYSYHRLSVIYEDNDRPSEKALVRYRSVRYDGTLNNDVQTMLLSSIGDTTEFDEFEIKEISGTRYIIIQIINYGLCAFILESNNSGGISPDNAGVYVCIATCNAYDNYIFSKNGSQNSSIQFANFYEIKKSSAIDLTRWLDKFYYTNKFDFKNQKLPFVYEISPSYLKQYVIISLPNYDNLSTSNYLNVGNYTAILTINTDNYCWQTEANFEVKNLTVDFVFPVLKNYVYIGQNSPVTSFLTNIRVVRRDENMIATESFFYDPYSSQCKNITLSYYDRNDLDENGNPKPVIDENGNNIAPYKIGDYLLVIEYPKGSANDNYEGRGEFEYSIIPRSFTGSVRVQDTILNYNPLYKQKDFYEIVKDAMFRIDSDGKETVTMYVGSYPQGTTPDETKLIVVDEKDSQVDYTLFKDPSEISWWLRELNKEGPHYITFVVDFNDPAIGSIQMSGILTIKKKTLTRDDFIIKEKSTYDYDGFPEYNALYFKNDKIKLDPDLKEYSEVVGDNIYRVKFEEYSMNIYGEEEYDPHVVVRDIMFNVIFELRYEYSDSSGVGRTSTVPIEPGNDYRSIYIIKGGDCYMTEGIGQYLFATFSIKKLEILYLNIRSLSSLNIQYSGENLLSGTGNNKKIGDVSIAEQIIVSKNDSAENDVYFTLYQGDAYSAPYGVYLEVFFTNSNNEIVYEIIESGTYYMNLAIAYSSRYYIVNYYDEICIGREDKISKRTADMTRDGTNNWYIPITKEAFTVGADDFPYNTEDYYEVFGFVGISTSPTVEGSMIMIDAELNEVILRIVDFNPETSLLKDVSLEVLVYSGNAYITYYPKDGSSNIITGEERVKLETKDNRNNYARYKIIVRSKNHREGSFEIQFRAPQTQP